jgi:hypothetical protein
VFEFWFGLSTFSGQLQLREYIMWHIKENTEDEGVHGCG